ENLVRNVRTVRRLDVPGLGELHSLSFALNAPGLIVVDCSAPFTLRSIKEGGLCIHNGSTRSGVIPEHWARRAGSQNEAARARRPSPRHIRSPTFARSVRPRRRGFAAFASGWSRVWSAHEQAGRRTRCQVETFRARPVGWRLGARTE